MSSDSEKFIRWIAKDKIAKVSHEASLLEVLIKDKVPINHTCGGNGTCGTCVVIVDEVNFLSQRNELEQEMALDRGFSANERLSCQVLASEIIDKKISIKIPISSL